MKNEYWLFISILVASLLLIDLYTFKGLRLLTGGLSNQIFRNIIHSSFWVITAILIAGIFFVVLNADKARQNPAFFTSYVMPLVGMLVLFTLPKIVFILFHLLEDIGHFAVWLYAKLSPSGNFAGEQISRRTFLTQLGAAVAVVPFVSIAYGMFKGKYDFRVLRETLWFENLPKNFDGLKIVLVSDIHIGSFGKSFTAVKRGIDMVNELEPDVIFFTGDLVNNYASETDGWLEYLNQFRAKKAKYSILGNHDYGDYVPWNSPEEKQKNLNEVIDFNRKMGFRILLNESEKFNIDGEEITIIGVENWGKPPFPQYGNLKKAMNGTETASFKILLSHDPWHWDAEVLGKTDIALTFSGHTHGMQFGVEVGGIKWSPVKFKYPRWGGLYTEGKQHLYVNRGFGFIGFPGRVGMPPEITLIELKKA